MTGYGLDNQSLIPSRGSYFRVNSTSDELWVPPSFLFVYLYASVVFALSTGATLPVPCVSFSRC
jgi:hypothetical protein